MYFRRRYAPQLILVFGALLAGAIFFASGVVSALAQEDTIIYPVVELGNCESKQACRAYCAGPEHMTACIAFAEQHGLMKKEEAEVAKKFARTLEQGGGPGGCTDNQSCRAYCEDISHIDECIAFAERHGHEDADVSEGKKVAAFIKSGGQMPGGCTSRQKCEAYCGDFEHSDECLAFAERAGLEMRESDGRKIDIEQIKKVHALMKSGETPGGCKSREQCEEFCESPDNADQCLAFAERAGFMKSEEIERARAMMKNGGPGGCKGRKQCEEFCRNPENQEACFAFAQEHGMMRPEDAERMKGMRESFDQGARGAPPGMGTCMREKIMAAMSGGGPPDKTVMEAVMQECMRAMRDMDPQPEHGERFGPFGDHRGEDEFGQESIRGEFEEMDGMPTKEKMMNMNEEEQKAFFEKRGRNRGERRSGDGQGEFDQRHKEQFTSEAEHQYREQYQNEKRKQMERGVKDFMQSGEMPKDMKGFDTNMMKDMMDGKHMEDVDAMKNKMMQGNMEAEYQKEYQKQHEQQYQQQYQQHQPYPGSQPPPQGDQNSPPSQNPPPPVQNPPPPTSMHSLNNMLANVFSVIMAMYSVR